MMPGQLGECGVLFTARSSVEPDDVSGCRLNRGHDGPHEFVSPDSSVFQWETDEDCDCADCNSDEPDDWCMVYWKVNSDTFLPDEGRIS